MRFQNLRSPGGVAYRQAHPGMAIRNDSGDAGEATLYIYDVIDELHAYRTRAVYDVIDTARGAREQSMLWNITTAGSDRADICYERRTHCTKVLERVIDDPTTFGVIYTIDDGDDPQAAAPTGE